MASSQGAASLWPVMSRSLAWQAPWGTLMSHAGHGPTGLLPPTSERPRGPVVPPLHGSSNPFPRSGPPCKPTRRPENVADTAAGCPGAFQGRGTTLRDTCGGWVTSAFVQTH